MQRSLKLTVSLTVSSQQLVDMLTAEIVIGDPPLAKCFLLIKVRKFP